MFSYRSSGKDVEFVGNNGEAAGDQVSKEEVGDMCAMCKDFKLEFFVTRLVSTLYTAYSLVPCPVVCVWGEPGNEAIAHILSWEWDYTNSCTAENQPLSSAPSFQLSDSRTDFTLKGDPEWFPVADFVPKHEDKFGFELGRACFCNNNDSPWRSIQALAVTWILYMQVSDFYYKVFVRSCFICMLTILTLMCSQAHMYTPYSPTLIFLYTIRLYVCKLKVC